MIAGSMNIVLLFGGPIVAGIVWAYYFKAMRTSLKSLILAYLLGAGVAFLVPFGLVSAAAAGASNSYGAAGLLSFSAYICGFLGLMAFIVAFTVITGDETNEN